MPKVRIGCCGFPVSRKRYFEAFDVVEVQQTFYQPPDISLAEKWRKEAPGGFEYTLKAWQLITHEPKSPTYRRLKERIGKEENYGFFKPTDEVFEAWERTREIADALDARIIVFQCPPSFEPSSENKENVKKFFSKIKRGKYILAWEPRGRWQKKDIEPLCRDLDLIHVVDPFKSEQTHGEISYYRLHGKGGYRYKYTENDLRYLKELIGKGTVYFMFNNAYMFEDALAFKRLVC